MSKSQRIKGANYELDIVHDLSDYLGVDCSRNLEQTRDGGADIVLDHFVIECKRRNSIAVYGWVDQAQAACKEGQTPIVVCRADRRESLAIMKWSDFLTLLGNEIK